MTVGKASALTASLIGTLLFGMWVGTRIADRTPAAPATVAAAAAHPTTAVSKPRLASPHDMRLTRTVRPVAVSAPGLTARMKPLLNQGTDMKLAARGFHSAGEFATVVHAAHNLNIPFILLQHRVLDEHMSLAHAIERSQPGVNGAAEAERARAEAAADLAALRG